MKRILLLFCVLLSTLGAKAVSVTVEYNGLKYFITDRSEGSSVSGIATGYESQTSFTVASSVTYNGTSYTIKRVQQTAFSGKAQLQSISLPNTVTEIGTLAFNGCTNLTSINWTQLTQLTTIDNSAFEGCTNLRNINLAALTSLTTIGNNAFRGCTSLTSIDLIGQNQITALTEIGDNAFSGCTKLTEVKLPAQLTKINSGTFEGCSKLTTVNWNIANGITEIGSKAFKGTGFTSLVIPSDVTTIGDYAFQDCTALTNMTLPANLTTFSTGLFKGCTALTSVTMNMHSSTAYAPSMFEGCTALNAMTSNGSGSVLYKSIGEKAFRNCKSLSNYKINRTLLFYSSSIGAYAFEGCTLLEEIAGIANSRTTDIGEGAFYNCENVTSFTAPDCLCTIGANAFEGCVSLTSATFGNSLESVGNSAFEETPITSVSLPSTVEEIAEDAFANCSALTSLTIGDDSEESLTIGDNAFCGARITTLSLPDRVESIGENAFGWCRQLETVNISDYSQLISIGEQAFRNTAIKKFTIPAYVRSIGEDIFLNCPNLRLVLIRSTFVRPDRVGYANVVVINQPQDSWYDAANGDWYYDAAHTQIAYIESAGAYYNVPDRVTSIGKNAFYGQTSLYTLTIPASVTCIGASAFKNCSNLRSVVLNNDNPDNITLGGTPFSGNDSDIKLSVPLGSGRLYKANRSWKNMFSAICLIDDELTLTEGQPYTLAYGEDNVSVTYNRKFNTTKWQALYIPFEMTSSEWSEFGEVAEISGVHQYEGSDGNMTVIEFRKLKSGESVMPNTPYVFRVNENWVGMELPLIEKSLKDLSPAESKSVWCASTRNTYTMTGVYESTTIADSYAIGGGEFQYVQGATLSPYRFYLTVAYNDHGYGAGSSVAQLAPARIRIMVEGEETGIDEIINNESTSHKCYDLSGRRVTAPQQGHIYIVNGKKVLY